MKQLFIRLFMPRDVWHIDNFNPQQGIFYTRSLCGVETYHAEEGEIMDIHLKIGVHPSDQLPENICQNCIKSFEEFLEDLKRSK